MKHILFLVILIVTTSTTLHAQENNDVFLSNYFICCNLGLLGAIERGEITPLGLQVENEEVILDIEWAYADANQIVVQYTLFDKGLLTYRSPSPWPTLMLRDGQETTYGGSASGLQTEAQTQFIVYDLSLLDLDTRETFVFGLPSFDLSTEFSLDIHPLLLEVNDVQTHTIDEIDVTLAELRVSSTMVIVNFCYTTPDDPELLGEAYLVSPSGNINTPNWRISEPDGTHCRRPRFPYNADEGATMFTFGFVGRDGEEWLFSVDLTDLAQP